MTDELPEIRKGHPYVMYDMLRDIPNGIAKTIEATREIEFDFGNRKVIFTGNGTAFHSAIAGAQIFGGNNDAIRFIQAYELENFWNPSGQTIVAYSHTGKTKSTVDAVRKHSENNETVGVSHYSDSPLLIASGTPVVIGNSPDASLCNTKAFFDNAFNAMILSASIMGTDADFNGISDHLNSNAADIEKQARSTAAELHDYNNIYFLGAGPDYVFARESAQKTREATHLRAEGIELEEFNHGCTAVMDSKTLLVIACNDVVKSRAGEIVRASREVDSTTVAINGSGDFSIEFDEHEIPAVNTLSSILAAYYLDYYLALELGVNPDMLRFEDERYLKYDSIVFPPGSH